MRSHCSQPRSPGGDAASCRGDRSKAASCAGVLGGGVTPPPGLRPVNRSAGRTTQDIPRQRTTKRTHREPSVDIDRTSPPGPSCHVGHMTQHGFVLHAKQAHERSRMLERQGNRIGASRASARLPEKPSALWRILRAEVCRMVSGYSTRVIGSWSFVVADVSATRRNGDRLHRRAQPSRRGSAVGAVRRGILEGRTSRELLVRAA